MDGSVKYRVKTTGRIVSLLRHLGDGRWLCTDYASQCHPCYNLSDLERAA